MNKFGYVPKLSDCGWTLLSAEKRHLDSPKTFSIPDARQRSGMSVGEAARLLFDIETQVDGKVLDRGVDRMWVIIAKVIETGYLGVLDSNPGIAENLKLNRGDIIYFRAEHICGVDFPPKDFLVKHYNREIANL